MDESKVEMNIFQRESNFDSKGEVKENKVVNMGRKQRGMMDLRGGQDYIG